MNQEIATRASVEERCRFRDLALQKYEEGVRLLLEAQQLHKNAAPGQETRWSFPEDFGRMFRYGDFPKRMAEFLTTMREGLDRDMWRCLITSTKLWSLMDKKEQESFEASLKKPIPVTPDVVLATVTRLTSESDMIFRRGLVAAFEALNRDYKSHDGFKLGDRIILTYALDTNMHGSAFRWSWTSLGHRRESELRDVDRIMHVLDGKQAPDYQQGLCAEIRRVKAAMHDSWDGKVETEYWRVRFFQNGNAHLWPKRQDLVDKANRMIAEHFGQTLGDRTARGTAEAKKRRPKHAEDFGYFPTPRPVVIRMMHDLMAGLPGVPGLEALEPSAGVGSIARALRAAGALVDCVEIHQERAQVLAAAGLYRSVRQGDFLDEPAVEAYDLVAMNPPFHDQADILHVRHAWRCLRKGGRLVAVMSGSTMHRQGNLAREFQAWVRSLPHRVRELDWPAFLESGTSVRAIILTLDKR